MLFELDAARDHMFASDIRRARHYLRRVHAIEQVGIDQIPVLETMSPQDFLEFRTHLAPASGFQSVQFREIEILSGRDPGPILERIVTTDEEAARLKRRQSEPTLWDAFCKLLEEAGLPMPKDDPGVRQQSLVSMARERDRWGDHFDLSEDLLDHDMLFVMWRNRHVLMVERQIGSKTGTGGSTGAPYLRSTLETRFFPELWDLRSYL